MLPAGKTVEVFYDGACPLCMREIRMLMRKGREAKIVFTDIAAVDFDPAGVGATMSELMAKIKGRLPDGTWIEGVEVFRQLYTAIGWGRVVAVTRVPGISGVLSLLLSLVRGEQVAIDGPLRALRPPPRRSSNA